jgi:hypothetical protein
MRSFKPTITLEYCKSNLVCVHVKSYKDVKFVDKHSLRDHFYMENNFDDDIGIGIDQDHIYIMTCDDDWVDGTTWLLNPRNGDWKILTMKDFKRIVKTANENIRK